MEMNINILKSRCILEYELLIKYSKKLNIDTGYNEVNLTEFKDEINKSNDIEFLNNKLSNLSNKRVELSKEIEKNKTNNMAKYDVERNHLLMVASMYRLNKDDKEALLDKYDKKYESGDDNKISKKTK